MGTRYASGYRAEAICDRCGFMYRLSDLRKEVVKGIITEIKACPECWDPDHPQLHLGEFPVYDPQALMDPRPDSPSFPQSRSQTVVAVTFKLSAVTGGVRVST